MSAVTLGDVRQAAAIIGANITDEQEREVVARQFAALFAARFHTFDTSDFLNRVERASDCPQDYTTE